MHAQLSREAAVRRVLLITLSLNVLVALSKIAYGTWNRSLSVRADGFHSLTDGANNVVGLVGVYLASRPADDDHPYGHEKLETLASGVVGLSLLAMAYDVLRGSIERWSGGALPPRVDGGLLVVLGLTLLVNVYVARFERRRGQQLNSPFLLSDAAHTRSDVLVTLGVIGTVVLVKLGYPQLDAVAALLVAGFIAWAGVGVLRSNVRHLADVRAIDPSIVERCVLCIPGVASTHKIRTRGGPGAIHVDLHIQIARHLDVVEAHRVTHWVIEAIKRDVPGVTDVLVHTEPAAPDQPFNPMP
ncbi:MAG TPA: cation diffusion facilitator family transporter [Polyangiaceae bacterium]|nr:cation diffusion facilitator family transporter [Polyangiaceae bacterium]